jgi:uncharacterized protein (DUF2062 family)
MKWGRWRQQGARIREVLHFGDDPRKIAAGLAVGTFISFTPYYGLHTLMALAAAFAFRLNVAATLVGAWIVIPPAIPVAMAFSLQVGWLLVGRPVRGHPVPRGVSALALWARLSRHLWPLVVGTTVVGLAAAAVAYVVTYQAVLRVRAARARSAQVGESKPSDADFQLDKPDPPV